MLGMTESLFKNASTCMGAVRILCCSTPGGVRELAREDLDRLADPFAAAPVPVVPVIKGLPRRGNDEREGDSGGGQMRKSRVAKKTSAQSIHLLERREDKEETGLLRTRAGSAKMDRPKARSKDTKRTEKN